MKNSFLRFLKVKFLNDIIFYQTIIFCCSLFALGIFFISNFKYGLTHSIIDQELDLIKKEGVTKICRQNNKNIQFYLLDSTKTVKCASAGLKLEEFKNISIGDYKTKSRFVYHHRVLKDSNKNYTLFLRIESNSLDLVSSNVFRNLFFAMGVIGLFFLLGQFLIFRFYFTPLQDLYTIYKMDGVIDSKNSRDFWDFIESKTLKSFNKSRKLQRQLFNTKQYYSVIINSIDDPVVVTNDQGRIIFCNDSFKKTFSSFNGKYRNIELINIIRDYDFINLIKKHGYNAIKIHNNQINLKSVAGDEHTYQLKTSVIESKSKSHEVFFYFSDITKLQNINNMRRDFFENISHEIKTPLTSIKGYSQTLSSINADLEQKELLEVITQNVDRLDELVNGILSLSKIENEGEIETFDINFCDFVNGLINDHQMKLTSKNIHVDLNCDGNIHLHTNDKLLYHCISNLISNAIKYSQNNTVVTITCGMTQKNEKYIRVTDQGVGIPNDKISRIFERFYRVDQSRSINTGGTGLGLAIAKHSAQKMNARIEVESEIDKGTTFSVIFNG